MTKEEAKLVLDNARPQTKEIDRQFYDDEDLNSALDIAIKALEQQTTAGDCVSREQAKIDVIPNSLYTSEQVITLLDSLPPVTPTFPKGVTNGNLMTAMFSNIKIHEHDKTDICDAYIQIDIWDFSICVSKDWWDAPYKRGSENG